MLTMDSLDAINQLQQFFADDTAVSWAVIGSQGIAVQYNNGMRGGMFLNPEDGLGKETMKHGTFTKEGNAALNSQHLVNSKEVAFLSPNYWDNDFGDETLIQHYGQYLPKVGMDFFLFDTILNQEANVNSFTKLSGKGFIYISSHGIAWPSDTDLQEVIVLTGEMANDITSEEYYTDIYLGDIAIFCAQTSDGMGGKIWKNIYLVNDEFIKDYNDFSKDTLLFYGAFCFSHLGGWSQLINSFAAGTYFGFDWAVQVGYCNDWADSLIKSMTDTSATQPITTEDWFSNSIPKSYFSTKWQRNVSIDYVGDANLTLWKKDTGEFYIGQEYGGGIIFYIDATGKHGLIAATSDQSSGIHWGCDTTHIAGTSTEIGTGQANTTAIVNECSETGAARICDDLVLNGYSDWFMPSKDELNQIYLQRNVIGGIGNWSYWSSAEYESYRAWKQNFDDGSQGAGSKSYEGGHVRAVRSF